MASNASNYSRKLWPVEKASQARETHLIEEIKYERADSGVVDVSVG